MFDNRPQEWLFDAHRPAGWYPDPAGTDRWEYWNGRAWSRRRNLSGIPSRVITPWRLSAALATMVGFGLLNAAALVVLTDGLPSLIRVISDVLQSL